MDIYLQNIYLQDIPTDVLALGKNIVFELISIRSNYISVLRST
jgi:hypothetical protein